MHRFYHHLEPYFSLLLLWSALLVLGSSSRPNLIALNYRPLTLWTCLITLNYRPLTLWKCYAASCERTHWQSSNSQGKNKMADHPISTGKISLTHCSSNVVFFTILQQWCSKHYQKKKTMMLEIRLCILFGPCKTTNSNLRILLVLSYSYL